MTAVCLQILRIPRSPQKIEVWILEQIGVTFDGKSVPEKLRMVAG